MISAPAPELQPPRPPTTVDPALQLFARNLITADPERYLRQSEAVRVRLADLAFAPMVRRDGDYTTADVDREVDQASRTAAAGTLDQETPALSLGVRLRTIRQHGGLQGHAGGRGLGQQVMEYNPIDDSPEAIARRRAARHEWERRQAARNN
jgi:hypothetical protein